MKILWKIIGYPLYLSKERRKDRLAQSTPHLLQSRQLFYKLKIKKNAPPEKKGTFELEKSQALWPWPRVNLCVRIYHHPAACKCV